MKTRTDASGRPVILFDLFDDDVGADVEIELPARFETCGRCEGTGRVMNEAIAEHAYGEDEWRKQDEDFKVEYMRGGAGIYGVRCPACNGRNVVAVPDESAADPLILAAYHKRLRDDREYENMCASERRMGA